MGLQSNELLENFCWINNLGITINENYQETPTQEILDKDFTYIDGVSNGNIYYYDSNNNLLCTEICINSNNSFYEFTKEGVIFMREELKRYIDWVLKVYNIFNI